ncbi:hypothetical protein L914_04627, partial [Phytophthora nicotianae]
TRALLYLLRGGGRKFGFGKRRLGGRGRGEHKHRARSPNNTHPGAARQNDTAKGNAASIARCCVCNDPTHKFTACHFVVKDRQLTGASANAVEVATNNFDYIGDSDHGGEMLRTLRLNITPQNGSSTRVLLTTCVVIATFWSGLAPTYLPR